MAGIYEGISGVARKVKNGYIGVSSVARKVKNGFVGVGSVARSFFNSELVLYDHGTAPYGVNTRNCVGRGTNYGNIGTSSLYINTKSYLADTYGNSGMDSYLCPVPFYIPNTAVRERIDSLTSVKVNVTISNLQKDSVKVVVGGFYGQYDTDDSGGYDFTPYSRWAKSFTADGTYEFTVALSDKDKSYMKKYTSDTYAQIRFGAETHTKHSSSGEYNEHYCWARVDFNYIAFL